MADAKRTRAYILGPSSLGSIIVKILHLYIILLCTHLYHFFQVSIHSLQCIHCLLLTNLQTTHKFQSQSQHKKSFNRPLSFFNVFLLELCWNIFYAPLLTYLVRQIDKGPRIWARVFSIRPENLKKLKIQKPWVFGFLKAFFWSSQLSPFENRIFQTLLELQSGFLTISWKQDHCVSWIQAMISMSDHDDPEFLE